MEKYTLKWNLGNLFETEADFYQEMHEIKEEIIALQSKKGIKLDASSLTSLLDAFSSIQRRSNRILMYGSLRFYEDNQSEQTKELKSLAESFANEVDAALVFIPAMIIDTDQTILDEVSKTTVYGYYISETLRKKAHLHEDKSDEIKQIKDSIQSLLKSYNELLSRINYGTIIVDNKEIELTPKNLAKYLSAKDRETRRLASEAANKAFEEYGPDFAEILNALYQQRTKLSELEQYESVIEKVLTEAGLNPDMIHTLIREMKKHQPMMHEYLLMKSKLAKIDEPHLYDLNAPLQEFNANYSLEEAIAIIKEALKPLGSEYLTTLDYLLDHHYIDASLDDKKHSFITFSWRNFSFMNYHDAYIDLKNLAHELGHAINAHLSMQVQPFMYEDSSVFIGEISSKVNEILLNRYLYEHATTDEERLFYLNKQIGNYFAEVYKQIMNTELESKLYKLVKDGTPLTLEILNETYASLVKEYYGDGFIYDAGFEIEWAKLGHLYRHSYYCYTYATGLLLASNIVNGYADEKTVTEEDYKAFLRAGDSASAEDLLNGLHIDLTDEKMMENGMKVLRKAIDSMKKISSK